jgi:hypothetical protein
MEQKNTITLVIILLVLAAAYYIYSTGKLIPGQSDIETPAENAGDIPTSADNAPPGSIHNLPVPEAVAKVRSLVAENTNTEIGKVIVLTAFEKEWSDSCLGLGGPAESCAAVITPGYEVTVQASGKEYTYRTNSDGTSIRQEI